MPHNNDMTEGFSELLNASGVHLQWEDISFCAIISTQPPTATPFALTPGDDQTLRVSALVKSFTTKFPYVGDYFEDSQDIRYRVKSCIRRPGQPVIRFTCEIS